MKAILATSLLFAVLIPGEVKAEPGNPFLYRDGKLSLGVVSGDTLALYDIFKHVDGITARVGASATLVQYDRLGAFVGAAAPTVDPSAIALVAGPSLDLDDVAKAMIKSLLGALPFNMNETTADNLASATRLKIYGGYDFRYKGAIAGMGFGIGLF